VREERPPALRPCPPLPQPTNTQVMAEAADYCLRKLLLHCQTPRAIPLLLGVVKGDKNARIRSSAASYLVQVRITKDDLACMHALMHVQAGEAGEEPFAGKLSLCRWVQRQGLNCCFGC